MENAKYLDRLTGLLKTDERLLVEGELNKNKAAELARKYDADLLNLLQSDKAIKEFFFVDTNACLVFKKDIFLQFIANKSFLPDSYTAYKNKIGLATGVDELLSENKEVVLNWPYKDAVLEGGQDKEDAKRNEVFFNEVLAPDQISRLLDDKVFTGWKRYDKDGEHDVDELKPDDNLILKGNNLVVLHSLKKRYAGKVKLIYIDPPYNTGNDSFGYNDRFNHSTWLTFMKNRLESAKSLLSEDGSIYVQLDNNEAHYGKVLMDEVFGAQNFQREIIWKLGGLAGYKSLINNYVRGHETILFYSKAASYKFNKTYLAYDEKQLKRFSSLDEQGRKYKTLTRGRRLYLEDAKGLPISDIWDDIASFQTVVNSAEIVKGFVGQKPEKLLQRIIETSTDKGDIVLDYHLGTGTTASVAHKLERQWIGVEQLDYGDNDPVLRLTKVTNGDQTGISKNVGWQGGGSFVYAHIKNDANSFRERIQKAATDKALEDLLGEAKKSSFLSYRVDPAKLNPGDKDFKNLSLAHKKQLLLELIDNNTLYVNYSDIDDKTYSISAGDKKHNAQLYARQG